VVQVHSGMGVLQCTGGLRGERSYAGNRGAVVLYGFRSSIGEHLSCSSTGIQGYSSSKDYMGAGEKCRGAGYCSTRGVVQGYRCSTVLLGVV